MRFRERGNDPGADIPAMHLVCRVHCPFFWNYNELPPSHAPSVFDVSLCASLPRDRLSKGEYSRGGAVAGYCVCAHVG